MKRFIKYVLIAAAICLTAGLLMSCCAAAMGGTLLRMNTGSGLLPDGDPGSLIGRIMRDSLSWVSVAGDSDSRAEEYSLTDEYPVADIRDLEITASPSRILIEEGETDGCIRVERTSDKIVLKDKCSDSSLKLTFGNGRSIVNLPEGEMVRITVPVGQRFRKVEIEADAASVDAAGILAEELDISVNAASVKIGNVSADEMKLEAEAGSVEIEEGDTKKLKIESAMGSVSYTGAVGKSVDADCEMGEIALTVDGAVDDFDYRIEVSVGSVFVEGLEDSGRSLQGERTVRHEGSEKTAKLDCGMGSVEMNFR